MKAQKLYKIPSRFEDSNSLPSIHDEMMRELLRVKEDMLKRIYKDATGEELTIGNAHEISLATFAHYPDELVAIRGNVVGMITYKHDFTHEGGAKMVFTFDPTKLSFNDLEP